MHPTLLVFDLFYSVLVDHHGPLDELDFDSISQRQLLGFLRSLIFLFLFDQLFEVVVYIGLELLDLVFLTRHFYFEVVH